MNFTDIKIIDPLMSIGVSVFIFVNAIKNLKEVLDLFLEKTPHGISLEEIKTHILKIDGVEDVHHIHIWSMDGNSNFATMHVVTNCNAHEIKEKVREELSEHGISHATLELEAVGEHCHENDCSAHLNVNSGHSHHHHHHH
jgi:cobalt-zinc-cadmium efflux system protein